MLAIQDSNTLTKHLHGHNYIKTMFFTKNDPANTNNPSIIIFPLSQCDKQINIGHQHLFKLVLKYQIVVIKID